MKIRKYKSSDCEEMAKLFHDTVHTINAVDYSKAHLDAWSTGTVDIDLWNNLFLEHTTYVAEYNGLIVGFGDMDHKGYLDKLYVHKDYQRRGIASSIVDALESELILRNITTFTTFASITAKMFFNKQGYNIVRENIVVKGGVGMINYEMVKYG